MLPISTLVSKTSCRKTEITIFLLKMANLPQFFPSVYNYRNTLYITIFKIAFLQINSIFMLKSDCVHSNSQTTKKISKTKSVCARETN